MTAPVAVRPGERHPSGICSSCWQRPAEDGWPTCKPCFFRPQRWRVPCTCTPTELADKEAA